MVAHGDRVTPTLRFHEGTAHSAICWQPTDLGSGGGTRTPYLRMNSAAPLLWGLPGIDAPGCGFWPRGLTLAAGRHAWSITHPKPKSTPGLQVLVLCPHGTVLGTWGPCGTPTRSGGWGPQSRFLACFAPIFIFRYLGPLGVNWGSTPGQGFGGGGPRRTDCAKRCAPCAGAWVSNGFETWHGLCMG